MAADVNGGAQASFIKYEKEGPCDSVARRVVRQAGCGTDAGVGSPMSCSRDVRADAWRLGLVEELDVERTFREARLYTVAPISANMVLNFVAERVLGLPRSY